MPIPSEITFLFERLNQELKQIEQETVEGLKIVKERLAIAPNSIVLIQLFATLSNYVFFVENNKSRI